jgi:hypothetical protein
VGQGSGVIDRYHLLLAAVAFGIGLALTVVDLRGPLVFRSRVTGLVLSAAALLSVVAGVARFLPWAVVAMVALAPADDGDPPHPLGRWTWPLALVSLVGVWASVPDTEPALVAGMLLAPVAATRCRRDESPGPVGTGLLVAIIVGAAWVGAAERVAPLCTATAVGAVLMAPLLLGYRRRLSGPGLALVAAVHSVLALGGCRWIMTMRPADALGAAVVVMGLDAIAVLAGAALSRPGDLAEEPG